MTNPSTTPAVITPLIVKTAARVSKNAPVFVDLVDYPGMEQSMCFENVEKMVREHQGRAIMGWCLWDWDGVLMDFEHHAVWQKPNGSWEDVTPKADGERRIVFVRDDTALYENQKSILNKRFAYPGNSLAKEFIDDKRKAELVWDKSRRTGAYIMSGDDMQRMQFLDEKAFKKWQRLLSRHSKP